jgi:protein arginine kinase activator
MSKPKECSGCQKPATTHLTQIIGGSIKKLDFCDSCPYQKQVTDPEGMTLAGMLAGSPSPLEAISEQKDKDDGQPQLKCSSCGFSPDDFGKHHRFGCPDCYQQLDRMTSMMINGMQAEHQHTGKVPQSKAGQQFRQRQLRRLKEQLQTAIHEERYEAAASLRDEIAQLEDSCQPGSTAQK